MNKDTVLKKKSESLKYQITLKKEISDILNQKSSELGISKSAVIALALIELSKK